MKRFDLEDVFLLSEIIDKMGLKVESNKLAKTIQSEKLENIEDVKELGKDVMLSIVVEYATKFISNLYRAKNEVIQLISNLTEMKVDAVKKMGFKQLKDFFVELVKNEGFQDFLSQVEASEE